MTYGEKISVGSILDERYEIKKIIKKNEKITIYEGWHQQIEESFLIQEMSKNTDDTDKILSRARRLSDFSEFTNLFQVCDQFSAGEKSYVIMEYPRGQCLEKVLSSEKKLSEKVLDHMFHSLLKTLEKLEEAGMKDIPVEAGTLYLQKDGSLYLFPETDRVIPGYTDYAYQICELMYQGLTGQKPPDKAIRLLFDEMVPLVESNPSSDVEFCRIIDEGLKISREEEPQKDSLGDLDKSLEQWREKENKKIKKKRYWVAGGVLSVVLICTVLFGLYLKFEEKIRFWGIKTETILLEPGEDVNRKEYQKSLEIIEKRVKDLVGTNKYLIKDDDGIIRIIMPEKACKKIDNEALLKEYLSRPMKLTVAVGNGSVKWFALASEQYVTLENKDILKVEEVDTEDSESWSTGETVNKMLKVTVSDEAAEQLKKKLGSLQEQINKETDDTEENDEEELIIKDSMERVLKKYDVLIHQKQLVIQNKLKNETICIGKSALNMILSNLMSNAIKYSKPTNSIEIGVKEDWFYIQNKYEDESIESGNGLGLYIVRNLLNNYNIPYELSNVDHWFVFKIQINV